MRKLLLSLLGIMVSGLLGAQSLAFHEDFELPSGADSVTAYSSDTSGIQNTWAISTDLYAGGMRSDSAVCTPYDTLTLTTNAISTVGNAFVVLNFDHICKIEVFDQAIIEVSSDGGITWTKLDTTHYMGASTKFGDNGNVFNVLSYSSAWKSGMPLAVPDNSWWKHETFNLSAIAANSANVTVRFSLIDKNGVATSNNNYGWFLDNIDITASPSELVPPVITLIPPLPPDTVYYSLPITIQADITDNSGIDTAYIVYYINGALTDTIGMTNISGNIFKGDIPFVGFGRTVTYFVEAVDMATVGNISSTSNNTYYLHYVDRDLKNIALEERFNSGTIGQIWTAPGWTNTGSLWEYEDGQTVSSDTGPSGPYEGTGYVFTEASSPNFPNVTGTITSPEFDISNHTAPLLIFSYHMYGSTMGTLNVEVFDGTGWQLVWTNTGQQHTSYTDPWTRDTVNLAAYKNNVAKVRFVGTTGANYYSDMSVDHVVVAEVNQGLSTDAGVAQIANPTGGVVANSNFDVKVKIKNFASINLTSADVNWTIDGLSQSTYNWTGNLATDSSSNDLTIGNISVGQGPHDLKIWTSNPNNAIDLNISNDTMHLSFYGCANVLSGTYTIGGTTPDFNTIADAALALSQCGISGPVTFNIEPGTYTEQISLPAINGSSATNTITFQSSTSDSSSVIMQYNALGAPDNYLVELDGTSNIVFKDMTFEALGSGFSRALVMKNHAENISLMNNRFMTGMTTTGGSEKALVYVEDTLDDNFTFTNNNLINGSAGLIYTGNASTGVVVTGNELTGQFASGITLSNTVGALIKNNNMNTSSTFDSFNAFVMNNSEGQFEISYNMVSAPNTTIGYGIMVTVSKGDSLNHAKVYNNMVLVSGTAGTNTLSCGILNMESKFVDYYYNTVKMTGNDQNTPAICLYDNTSPSIATSGLIVKNNILANMAGGYVIFTLNINSGIVSDYNDLYSDGTGDYINFNGTLINDLAGWKSATGLDTNSVNIDPYFAASTDLHTTNNLMNATGTPISSVTDDIDGDTRNSSTPDIGADEFDPSPYDLTLVDIISPQSACGLTSTEDVTFRIKNIGSASVSSFSATYQVLNGSTAVTETINTTLNPGDTVDYTFNGKVDLDVSTFLHDSIYPFRAYVSYTNDPIHQNDSIYTAINSRYQPPAPTATTYTINYADSVTITAASNDTLYWFDSDTDLVELSKGKYFTTPPLYDTTNYWVEARAGSANLKITEVTQYHGYGSGATTPAPSWLAGDDFVEITNMGTAPADLTGYVYNREGTGAFTYNFPAGITLNSGEVLILATYLGSVDDPANNYYVAANLSTSSSSATGHWLVNDQGVLVDAVALNGHSFSSSAVTSADWSGSIPNSGSNAGVVRTVSDNNTASDWQISSVIPQSLGSVNPALSGSLSGSGNSVCPSARIPVLINVIGFPSVDAGISAVVNPAASVPSGTQQYIDVELYNYGLNTLTAADITWELDGQLQNTYSWTGSIAYGDKDTIRIDSASFGGGVYDLRTWTSLPNGIADTINTNDTTSISFNACLNGYYTIGDTTQGSYDFNSFTDAVNALIGAGVCGHVVFEADSGVYNETLTLPEIPSMNASNTVTFTSMSGDSTDVVIEGSPIAYTEGVIHMNKASYFTFKNLTLTCESTASYGRIVYIENGSHYNKFENCVIETNVSTSSYFSPVYSTGSNDNYNEFRNNHILNGYYAFYYRGSGTTSRKKGTIIENNVIEGFYYYGLYLYYHDSIQVKGNYLQNRLNAGTVQAVYTYYCFNGFTLANNTINLYDPTDSGTKYGLRVYYANYYLYVAPTDERGLVYNNMININTNGSKYGLYSYYANDVEYYYNTIQHLGGGNASRPLYQHNSTSNTIGEAFVNNIFIDNVGDYAAYYNTPATLNHVDYNNYYTLGGNIANWNGDQSTLADLQGASGKDANSLSVLPVFAGAADLHLDGKQLSGKGTPVSAVTTDIDGDLRSSVMPTIGADEVDMLPVDIGIANILNIPSTVNENDTIYPKVVVINSGTDTIANYTVDYTINGGTPVTYNVYNDTIYPYGNTDTLSLAYYISPAGLYQLCATTVLAADSNIYNDEYCQDVFGTPTFDGYVTSIDDLESGCGLVNDTIAIIIKNIGADTIQAGFPAKYMVDGITLVEDTVNTQLLPGDFIYFEFSQLVDLTVTTFDSTFNIAAWVEVPGDNVTYNDTQYVSTVSKHTPAIPIVNDMTIGYGSSAQLTGSATAPIYWYYNDTVAAPFYTGDTLQTSVLLADTTFWFNAVNGTSGSPILITEYSSDPDFIEVMNVAGVPFDATGWQVIASDNNTNPDIAETNTWTLGQFQAKEVQAATEAAQYANSLPWTNTWNIWVMIVDDKGVIRDFAARGFTASQIQNMSVNAGGFTGLNPVNDNQWSGGGAPVSTDYTYRLTYDSDDATDWVTMSSGSQGLLNPGLTALPNFSIAGCKSPRDSVNIFVITPAENAGLTDITIPSGCDLSMEPVTIDIVNNGTDTIIGGLTATYKIDDNPYITPEAVSLVINPYDTMSYTFNALADVSKIPNGDTSYIIKSYVTLNGDTLNYNDTITSDTVHAFYTPPPPSTSSVTGVYGDAITISAISNDTLVWFDNATATKYVDFGKYYTTPILYDTITFWVAAAPSMEGLGPNIAPNATVTGVGLSSGSVPWTRVNDLDTGVIGTQQCWISTSTPPNGSEWFAFTWPTEQVISGMKIFRANNTARTLTGATLQKQTASGWVDFFTWTQPQGSVNVELKFPPVKTDAIRVTDFKMTGGGQQSNPNFREIEIYQAAPGGCLSPKVPLTVNVNVPDANAALTQILVNEDCNLKVDEPITIEVANLGAQPIDGNATAAYRVNGGAYITPETITTVINPGDTGLYTFATTHNMLAPLNDTSFFVEAYVSLANDTFPLNDSLVTDTIQSYYTPHVPIVADTNITFGSFAALVANSSYSIKWYETEVSTQELDTGSVFVTPILYDTTTYWVSTKDGAADLKITEVVQFETGQGQTPNYPSWITGVTSGDFDGVEISNLGSASADLSKYSLNFYSTDVSWGVNGTFTFPAGAVLDPGEVAIVDIKNTASINDLANNYYGAGLIGNPQSNATQGYYIINDKGDVIDAVATNSQQFASSTGVSSADWSGNIASSSGRAGVIRTISDNNTASDWVISSTSATQTFGTINPMLSAGLGGSGCESDRVPITVNVTGAPPIDGQLLAINEPVTGFLKTANEPVTVSLKNNGLNAWSSFDLTYEFDGQAPVTETFNTTMNPGDSLVHTFNQTVNMMQFKSYSIKAYLSLSGDTVNLNDTLYKSVQNKLDYCLSKANNTSDSYIEAFSLSGINTYDNNGTDYTDYTSTVAPGVLFPGVGHPVVITHGSAGSFYTVSAKVFIDINRDGVFDEATETFLQQTISSSAIPAFTGNIQLPLNINPGLTMMRVVMQETASLSSVHPCGTYGYGETEDYLVQITPLIAQDAGVVAIPKPNSFNINANQQFTTVVRNFGSDTIHTVDINYTVGTTTGSHTYTTPIPPQELDTVSMPIITLPYGNHNLCAFTVLPGDSNTFNDGTCKNIYRSYTTQPPYIDNFEGPNYFMKDTTSGKGTQWELGYPMGNNITSPHSGSNAWMIDLDSNYLDAFTDVLYTPKFAITNKGVDSLVFWHYYDTESGDGCYVRYLNVTGYWTTLGMVNDTSATNWYTDTVVGQPGFSGNSGGWVRSAICIDSLHVPNMASITQFSFVFTSDASGNSGDGWAIDDIWVKVPRSQYDGGVTQILTPVDTTTVGDQVTVSCRIKNYGYDPLTSIPVTYKVGTSTPVTETWTGNLATDGTDVFTFTTAYTGPGADYQLCVYTEHPQDGDLTNDQRCRFIYKKAPALDAGMVDIAPMVNYNGATDTILPGNVTIFNQPVKIKVWFTNYGSSDLTSMDLQYKRGTQPAVAETWTGTLSPSDTMEYTFTQTYSSGIGFYNTCASTLLTGDADPANDEVCESFEGKVSVESRELPGFILYQNIPNPATGETRIDFEVPYGGKARLVVRDVFGREMLDKEMNVVSGSHTVGLDVNNWSSGMYYYSVEFDGYRLVKKLVKTR